MNWAAAGLMGLPPRGDKAYSKGTQIFSVVRDLGNFKLLYALRIAMEITACCRKVPTAAAAEALAHQQPAQPYSRRLHPP